MRLDKYLKVSRIIKRRTVAKEACEGGRVSINDKIAKPSTEVKEGDIIEIRYASKSLKARIVNIAQHVTKENAQAMYEIISGQEDEE
ncbi:RNA-binding protein S4 [Clostridium carboxidivorans P7]|uniref:RQC P-site tRNA stabilizing factor n=1 Tax=Clostridium carboxidivorans P7 TaxID=536227 RepID=C6PQE1_9CLOT|nr:MULTISPECIES: RNA-binding S4 domain-containing protein [Clostridium]AKN33029.1 RNA-binding protein S4 [Clostridium carboxidivorans P7]EET88611.1 RNA-binding S4 domain protein [Clostridium carboxidivorans P7]EFG88049.1 S4 domain protein [Clostridium carboxidivorans P7]WPC41811.1 RNA-binding S4 domain-containing protein [Clostridium sp. JS66]